MTHRLAPLSHKDPISYWFKLTHPPYIGVWVI